MENKMNISDKIEFVGKSLQGLSIGDAFGDSFYGSEDVAKNYPSGMEGQSRESKGQ